jgi:signal transduction histidine kinase
VVVINPSGQVACINAVAAEFLSLRPVLPASLNALPAPIPNFVRQALEASCSLPPLEIRIQSEGTSGHTFTLDASLLAFGGDQQGLLLLLRGVHVNNPLEAKIRHFERLARLGVLSASLAHELRNSMVALSTLADILIEQQRDNELAQTVRRELDRANTLAVRMLKYARPDTLTQKPVSTHEILQRALRLANSRFKEAGATVTQSLLADPDTVSADETHLEQMFLNLLLNAADAIDSNGDVSLTTEIIQEQGVGRAIRIAFKDSGVGIAPEILPNLFQPFFTTKRHGTGLGLYLTRRIVDEHSGSITVDSSPGQGTSVHVCLPVYPD